MASRVRPLTETDAAEWELFARRIKPLSGQDAAVRPDVSPSDSVPDVTIQQKRIRREPRLAPAARGPELGIGGQPPGVDTATWQKFHRGQLRGERKLDLHGMTAHHAFAALRAFLRAAQSERLRCVEIVTGRGSLDGVGVLRRELPMWLNLPDIRPMVLAAAHPRASSALHAHISNPGSVRLLLKRPRA